jgi:hydrolase of X-linked nucleoside diphosphate
MEDQWLTWAKRLQAIASTGLHFSRDDFGRERYREVATIAQSMLASLGNIPIKRIEGLISDFAKGYATPKIDVRGAIIEDGKVLLVRDPGDASSKGISKPPLNSVRTRDEQWLLTDFDSPPANYRGRRHSHEARPK